MILKPFVLLLAFAGTVLVLESVDAAFCRQHEILLPIAPNCEKTCDGGCSTHSKRYVIQRPACICRPGFVRSGGACVPFSSCKPPTSPPPCPTTTTTAAPTCPPVVTTTPAPITCPPVTVPATLPTTTPPAPCPTSTVPPCAVPTNPPPPCQVAVQPCVSCGAPKPCPCRPLVGFKFI
ncbi:uncharacterized protein LOC120424501 [Culex pipiens pallens]|uniref:uncharacterized protein LOC120424501 n=1 Tax=Culex pipiens pallens TaxID=42434 RepID=UPI001952CBDF|nr:uncharacterized protein LOC120424501 [Culex pipiens pallens]